MTEHRRFITATPENSETPLEGVQSWVTQTPLFFVRNHFDIPQLDADTWRLVIGGFVETPLEITFADLEEMPQRTLFVTLECAGNGRSFLSPAAHGVQWGAGAIGHAEWTGVPLKHLLKRAGLTAAAREAVFVGADQGTEADHPQIMSFARSLPVETALRCDAILATRMNGAPLEPNHGYPVRLVVPGWYGVASVKWLTRIDVIDHEFKGYFQTKKYTYRRRTPAGEAVEIVGPMAVKSEIIRPAEGATLSLGGQRLFGVAWAGEELVAGVDVSTDGGQTWNEAELLGPAAPYSWTLWEYVWEAATPDEYALMSRATSASGRVQPLEHSPLHGGYIIHHSRPRRVRVEATYRKDAEPRGADAFVYDMNAFAEENARLPLDVLMEFTAGAGI